MAPAVRELDHGELKCDPKVLYLEIELDGASSLDDILVGARAIISERLSKLRSSRSE